MKFKKTNLEGVVEIFPNVFGDARGSFFESYNADVFKQAGIDIQFMQDNQSMSSKGVLRGLHFQAPPFAQDKLVRVVQGSAVDVAVDIRKHSPTYGQHAIFLLTAKENNMVLIPKGFAHGFLALEDHTIFSYKCSAFYSRESEKGLLWNDPKLNIRWGVGQPIVSEKDKILPLLSDFDSPF